jgi:hypothetical protein
VAALAFRAAIPLLLIGASLGFYWEIAAPDYILADYDVWTYFYPLREYAAEAIRAGRFPLWNPDTFLGSPFFANPQTSVLYPGTALFYVLPVAYAYSLSVIAHVFLASLLTYAFLRVTFTLGRPGALVGAVAFAFGGFLSSQVGHINQMSASAWLPGIVLAADLAVRRRDVRWAALAALALGIQLLAGHAQESYMSLWVVGIVLVWRATVSGPADDTAGGSEGLGVARRLLLRPMSRLGMAIAMGGLVAALGFAVAAVQLLPTLELSEHSIRSGGMTYLEAASFSLQPPLLVRSLLPGYWNNVFSEYVGYVGASGLAFAAVGFLLGPWRPMLCALALTQIAMFFAFGGANPLYRHVFDVIPGLDLFRVPARWLFVYSFGAAGLAAIGADWALNRSRLRPNPWRVAISGLAIVGLGLAALPLVMGLQAPLVTLWIAGLAAGFLVAMLAVLWPGPALATAAVVLVAVELRFAAMDLPQRHPVPYPAIEETRPIAASLRSTVRDGRILSAAPTEYEVSDHVQLERRFPRLDPSALFAFKSALKLDEVMSPNVPLRYGLSTVDGYDGGVLPLRRYLDVASLLVPRTEIRADGVLRTRLIAIPDDHLLRLFNVHAVIANEVTAVELGGFRFDVATARTVQPGQTVRVDLAEPLDVDFIALLSSATTDQLSQTDVGITRLTRSDETEEELPLTYGEDVFHEMGPGRLNAFQPTAGLSRGGMTDTATITQLEEGPPPVTAIEWTWTGRGPWNLRAVTIATRDGSQRQLTLLSGFAERAFPPLRVYYRAQKSEGRVPLLPRATVGDDQAALASMVGDPGSLTLAPETPSSQEGQAEGVFRRVASTPERLVFERVEGPGGGYLVVDDAWFPGWRAEVDGIESPLLRGNVYFKAVWVPEAARRVELMYEPRSLRLGAALSLAALLIVVALLILGWARRRA